VGAVALAATAALIAAPSLRGVAALGAAITFA
jgi:hypothetical protein